jgi:hypothetical protein
LRSRLPASTTPALGIVLIATALAGCGSSSSGNGLAAKTPTEILAATKAAADAATSVHVSGSVVAGTVPITLDMDLITGKGARGRLSESGLSFDLIEVGGSVYIKGSSAFYSHVGGSAAAQLLQGKWLKAPTASSEFASLASLTDLRQLVDSTVSNRGTLVKGATTTVNGQKALSLTDTSKGGTLYVATTGKPYPVEVTKSGSSGGRMAFDRWNESVTVAAPANSIDISQLRSGH